MLPIPFAVGFYQSPSLPTAAQECVNHYVNIPENAALSDAQLFERAGLTSVGTAGSSPNRGSVEMAGVGYHVNGGSLYSHTTSDVITSLGSIPNTNYVSMAHNGEKLCIVVPGDSAWVYSTAGGLVEITDPDLATPDSVVYKDGYYVFTDTAGQDWRVSNLNQPGVLNALDFGSAEADPDPIVCGHVAGSELYICGTRTIQPFQNIGGVGFPFQAIYGGTIRKGVIARHSLVNIDGGFAFVGGGLNEKAGIWAVSGGVPIKLSTDAIDHAIQQYPESENKQATGWTYSLDGEQFVAFNFTSQTFVYQVQASRKTGRPVWVEFGSGAGSSMGRSRITSVIKLGGRLLAGDTKSGNIGLIDVDAHSDYGETYRCTFSTQPFAADGLPYLVPTIEPTYEAGVGSSTDDPLVELDWSDDGRTWHTGLSRGLGKQGEYTRRSIFRRLGRVPRFRMFRFHVSDSVKRRVLKLEATIG